MNSFYFMPLEEVGAPDTGWPTRCTGTKTEGHLQSFIWTVFHNGDGTRGVQHSMCFQKRPQGLEQTVPIAHTGWGLISEPDSPASMMSKLVRVSFCFLQQRILVNTNVMASSWPRSCKFLQAIPDLSSKSPGHPRSLRKVLGKSGHFFPLKTNSFQDYQSSKCNEQFPSQ